MVTRYYGNLLLWLPVAMVTRYYGYTGPDHNVESAGKFIQDMFCERNLNKNKIVYPHFTTATDTSNIRVVFKVVLDTIIRENLEAANLL